MQIIPCVHVNMGDRFRPLNITRALTSQFIMVTAFCTGSVARQSQIVIEKPAGALSQLFFKYHIDTCLLLLLDAGNVEDLSIVPSHCFNRSPNPLESNAKHSQSHTHVNGISIRRLPCRAAEVAFYSFTAS